MPRYDDDQCANCGGVRVAKSTLCADCLIKQLDRERRKKWVLQKIIDKRDLEIAISREQIEKALAYGFKQNQENARLNRYVRELETRIAKNWEDQLW